MNNKYNEESFDDHRPGLRCRLVRRWEAWRGAASGLTPVVARHCERCAGCAEFFADDALFEQALRRDAGAVSSEPSVGFEQRILRAVRESQSEPPRARVRPLSLALAGLAAGGALAIVVVQLSMVKNGAVPPQVATTPEAGVPEKVPVNALASTQRPAPAWWASLGETNPVRTFATRNPLQEEIDSVYTDAQSVLGFLALNFLPTPTESDAGDAEDGNAGRG